MLRSRLGLALILVLAALVLLAGAAPSLAHTGSTGGPLDVCSAPSADGEATSALASPSLTAAPAPPGIPWPALAGTFILAALGWRRPRRTLVFAMVLLLAVFAFEDGLHSVHHLLDKPRLAKCTVAAASAHLQATAIDDGGVTDVILPAPAVAMEAGQCAPVARFLRPSQGRAPPTRFA